MTKEQVPAGSESTPKATDEITSNDIDMKRLFIYELELRYKILKELSEVELLEEDEQKEALRILLKLIKDN